MGWLFFAPTQSVDHTSGVANISQEDQWKIDTWSLLKFYFERHEAFVRFFDTGEVGPLTEIYSAEAHKFTSVNEVSLAKICPAQVDYRPTVPISSGPHEISICIHDPRMVANFSQFLRAPTPEPRQPFIVAMHSMPSLTPELSLVARPLDLMCLLT